MIAHYAAGLIGTEPTNVRVTAGGGMDSRLTRTFDGTNILIHLHRDVVGTLGTSRVPI